MLSTSSRAAVSVTQQIRSQNASSVRRRGRSLFQSSQSSLRIHTFKPHQDSSIGQITCRHGGSSTGIDHNPTSMRTNSISAHAKNSTFPSSINIMNEAFHTSTLNGPPIANTSPITSSIASSASEALALHKDLSGKCLLGSQLALEKSQEAAMRFVVSAFSNELSRHLNSSSSSLQYKQYTHRKVNMNMNGFNTGIQIRSFSTTSSGDNDERKKIKRKTEEGDELFTEYLTGKMEEGGPSISISPSTSESSLSDSKPESSVDEEPNSADSSKESSARTGEESKTQSTDEWFNNLLSKAKDLGRPKPELNETYRKIERANFMKNEKSRELQITTVRRALGGNSVIAVSKLAAYLSSGSSAMLSEFIHSIVDCGNQSLLLVGLHKAGNKADPKHPYGYGKSIYFYALVSALGTFFLGAGVSMTQAIPSLIYGGTLHEVTWHVWSVLGFSFAVDGYVFTKTLMEVKAASPVNTTLWKNLRKLRDPVTLAILLEDGAACLGIVMAIGGIAATQAFDMPVFDALAGVGISGLLAAMGIILVQVNHEFLLGQSVDKEIRVGIEEILRNRRSIDNVNSVQSQWTGPNTFSYKAEVDFDGTFLAAKLMPRYQQEFAEARHTLDQDLRLLLSWYAEDVMRTVEREVRDIEAEIRKEYPGAQYIELEPMSKDADRFAIDDGLEASLKRIEIEALNRYLKSLYQPTDENKK